MGTSKVSEESYREKYEQLRRENRVMAMGADLHNQAFEKMRRDNETLKAQVARLSSELQTSQLQVATLGGEIHNASRAATNEVIRLRALCKAHGIDPND